VNGAHKLGLEVILDVVYNHAATSNLFLGLDGCELNSHARGLEKTWCPTNNYTKRTECDFGSYFYLDERQMTQWGPRYKFSSEEVSAFLEENIRYWIEEIGFDGLRFDSTGCIRKSGGTNHDCAQDDAVNNTNGMEFLRKSNNYLSKMGKLSIAEDYAIMQTEEFVTAAYDDGGLGFDAQWDDSLYYGVEYAFRTLENNGVDPFSRLLNSLQYQCSTGGATWISYTENHDLSSRTSRSSLLSRAGEHGLDDAVAQVLNHAILFTSCGTPMLFQSQEVGETRPFDYDRPPKVNWNGVDPRFSDSADICYLPENQQWKLFSLTRQLIQVYKSLPALQSNNFSVLNISSPVLGFVRGSGDNAVLVILNFGLKPFKINKLEAPLPGTWTAVFDSSVPLGGQAQKYHGGGNKHNLLTFDVPAMATLILHPGETQVMTLNFKANCVLKPLLPGWAVCLTFLAWIMVPALILTTFHRMGSKSDLVKCSSSSCTLENGSVVHGSQVIPGQKEEEVSLSKQTIKAMICSLEHSLPETECTAAVNQKCGGLGKVV
jgi:1,4-alpha-glucan branching enzyme